MNLQVKATPAPRPAPVAIDQLSRRRRIGILLICCLSLFIVGVDVTVVNVALPAIGRHLHAGISGLQWTVDAYTVVMASLLMLAGSTADRFGRKRVFTVGLAVFSLASLLCSVAPSLGVLVACRALQGVGGSMLNPVAMSIVTNTFTDPRERAQAVGVWGAMFGISMALGPVLGGALVSSVGWRAIFVVNVPVGVAAIGLTRRFVPESRAPQARRFDPVGQVLVITLLAALTYGVIESQRLGWSAPAIIAAFAVAALALVAVIAYEPRRREPLLELRFFRSVPFASAIVISVASFAAFGGFLFLNTLYLQESRGLSAIGAGLETLPMAAMMVVMSPLSGRIVGRRGARLPLIVAGGCTALGLAALTAAGPHTAYAWLVPIYLVVGVGFGLVNAPITNTAVSGMPRAQAGVAAAVATTSRQVGQTLGVAVTGAIVGAAGLARAGGQLTQASGSAWWTLAACGAVVVVLGVIATGERARATARRTAAELNPEALA